MVKGIGGLGFLDNFHCEKTSFFTLGSLLTLIVLVFFAVVYQKLPTTNLFGLLDFPISYIIIALVFTLGGYLGVLFYRFTNNKKPLFVLRFWDAEA